jgi:hypothetical protein
MKSGNEREGKPLGDPPLGLLYNTLERKREKELVTTWKGGPWRCVVTENGQHAPLTRREPAKINKLLCLHGIADFAATHSTKVKKISVLQQKFPTYKNQKYN